jgi:nitrogen fixation protein FixH
MSMATTQMTQRDRWIPWYFVAFFVFIALVDGVMVTLAVNTHTGLVTDHPYEKGLAYNQVVKAEKKQEALGWESEIEFVKGVLHFALRDRNNQTLVPEKITATLVRPTQAGMDFSVEMNSSATPVAFPAPGLWEARIDAIYQGVHYQQSRRIVVE